jgi:hypothetical protein
LGGVLLSLGCERFHVSESLPNSGKEFVEKEVTGRMQRGVQFIRGVLMRFFPSGACKGFILLSNE